MPIRVRSAPLRRGRDNDGPTDPNCPQGSKHEDFTSVDWSRPIDLRRNDLHRRWILGNRGAVGAHDMATLAFIAAPVASTRDALAPPRGWLAGAALALIVAGALMRRRPRPAAIVADWGTWREGHVDAVGTVRATDGAETTCRARADYLGDVRILGDDGPPDGTYHAAPTPASRVVHASRARLTEAIDATAAAHDALVLAVVALGVAPLVVCAFVRLLG